MALLALALALGLGLGFECTLALDSGVKDPARRVVDNADGGNLVDGETEGNACMWEIVDEVYCSVYWVDYECG